MKKILAMLLAAILVLSLSGFSAKETESPVALRIDDMEFTVEDMNYMYITSFNDVYNNLYSYYGQNLSYILDVTKPLEEQIMGADTSWHQYILDVAIGTTKSAAGVYKKAIEEGFVLPEDYQKDLDTLEEQLDEIAAESGMTKEEYIYFNYGEDVSIESIKKMTELQLYCNAYVQNYSEQIEVTDEDISAYYKANKKDIDTVDFRFYSFYYGEAEEGSEEKALTQEEAKAQAEALAAVHTAEEFNALAKEYTVDEEQKKLFDEGDATLFPGAGYGSTGIDEVSEWLFDENRKNGDTMIYFDEDYQSYLVIMFEERIDPDYDYIDVRHILIAPEEAEDGTVSDEAWTAAEEKANEIYNGYLAGEATEEAFAELAKEHSADGNAARGGIYENVYKGQMVQTFNDWCYDAARVPGDSGIVKTPYGFHLMYFVGTGDNNLVATIEPTIIQEKTVAFIADCEVNLTEETTDEIENVGGMIDDIVARANEMAGIQNSGASAETEKETKSYTGIIIGVLVAIIIVCIIIIIKNAGKKKAEPSEETEEVQEESVLEATDEDLTEEELLAEEAFEENPSEEAAEEATEE